MFTWTAFLLGLFGSFHCVGMCGPIALTIPSVVKGKKWLNALLYNSGRAITYSLLGVVAGAAGYVINFSIHQGVVSVLSGLILLAGLFFIAPENRLTRFVQQLSFIRWVKKKMGKLFSVRTSLSVFTIGLLNGLLPCGFVYVALAGALAWGDVFHSAVFMFFFGLGTIPALFIVSWAGGLASLRFRSVFKKIYPAVVTVMALLLILRGLNLGIPFLSPQLKDHQFTIKIPDIKNDCVYDCCAPSKK